MYKLFSNKYPIEIYIESSWCLKQDFMNSIGGFTQLKDDFNLEISSNFVFQITIFTFFLFIYVETSGPMFDEKSICLSPN